MQISQFNLDTEIDLAVCRDNVVYFLSGGKAYALPVASGAVPEVISLPFTPTTWAYGQLNMVLYNPSEGLALVRGAVPVYVWTGKPPYAAPYGAPFSQGKPLLGDFLIEKRKYLKETNGFVWAYRNVEKTMWMNPHTGRYGLLPIIGADPFQDLVIQGVADEFVVRHGMASPLLYAQPPKVAVPYTLKNNTILIGCESGYCFSPDMGRSWRLRKLDGFGVATDKALLYINKNGLFLHTGVV